MPWEWWVGVLCEEFHCLPQAVLREIEDAPVGLLEHIVEMRHYARAKARYEAAKDRSEISDDPLTQVVQAIEFEIAQEQMDALKHGRTTDVER